MISFVRVSVLLLIACVGGHGRALNGSSLADLQKRQVDCDKISKYPTEYFLNHPNLWAPKPSTCLFYTYGLSPDAQLLAIAQNFAHSPGEFMTTIWDMWPKEHYNGNTNDVNNPLQCIMKDTKKGGDRQIYFENMSRAMARVCSVSATVMTDNPQQIPQSGIWGRVEQVELQAARDRNQIFAVNKKGQGSDENKKGPDGSPPADIIWTRPGNRPVTGYDDPPAEFHETYDLGQLVQWFSDVDW